MRQSPCATASGGTMPTASGLLKSAPSSSGHWARNAMTASARCRLAGGTRWSRGIAARAGADRRPAASCAEQQHRRVKPAQDSPKVLAASCSHEPLVQAARGESPRMSASRSAAAESGCRPAARHDREYQRRATHAAQMMLRWPSRRRVERVLAGQRAARASGSRQKWPPRGTFSRALSKLPDDQRRVVD